MRFGRDILRSACRETSSGAWLGGDLRHPATPAPPRPFSCETQDPDVLSHLRLGAARARSPKSPVPLEENEPHVYSWLASLNQHGIKLCFGCVVFSRREVDLQVTFPSSISLMGPEAVPICRSSNQRLRNRGVQLNEVCVDAEVFDGRPGSNSRGECRCKVAWSLSSEMLMNVTMSAGARPSTVSRVGGQRLAHPLTVRLCSKSRCLLIVACPSASTAASRCWMCRTLNDFMSYRMPHYPVLGNTTCRRR